MAKRAAVTFRTVRVDTWEDEWFGDLPAPEKVVFLYLFTSPKVSHLGVFAEIPYLPLRHNSGLSREDVDKVLEKFQRDGKVVIDGKALWIVNFIKNQTTSQAAKTGMLLHRQRELAALESEKIRAEIVARYPELAATDGQEREAETEFTAFCREIGQDDPAKAGAGLEKAAQGMDAEEVKKAIEWGLNGGSGGFWKKGQLRNLARMKASTLETLVTQYQSDNDANAEPDAVSMHDILKTALGG